MKTLNSLLEGNNLAYAASIIIGIAVACYFLYNTMSFYFLKEKYHGIRFTTKNISYITIMIAVSVSITIVISQIFPITVIPSIRIVFEGLMVKITGFIFGPIVGFLVGLITEGFMVIFVPSYLHPAFLITVIAFGFISGLGSSFIKLGKGSDVLMLLLINIFLLGFGTAMWFVIQQYKNTVSIFGFVMTAHQYAILFLCAIGICIFTIWFWFLYYIIKGKKAYLKTFLPIFLLSVAEELMVVVLITPWGDAANLGLSSDQYMSLLVARLVQVPFKIILNVIIIKTTYDIVNPLVNRDW